jgi:hypothetical protein
MRKPFWIGRTSFPFTQLTCFLSICKPFPEWFVAIDHHSLTSSPQYAPKLRCALTDSQPFKAKGFVWGESWGKTKQEIREEPKLAG